MKHHLQTGSCLHVQTKQNEKNKNKSPAWHNKTTDGFEKNCMSRLSVFVLTRCKAGLHTSLVTSTDSGLPGHLEVGCLFHVLKQHNTMRLGHTFPSGCSKTQHNTTQCILVTHFPQAVLKHNTSQHKASRPHIYLKLSRKLLTLTPTVCSETQHNPMRLGHTFTSRLA